MAEAIVEPIVEPTVEKEEAPAAIVEEPVAAEPKKRGRPSGAKDRAPRKKKVTVVEEPLPAPPPAPQVQEPEPPKAMKPAPKAAPKVSLEPPVEEPPSPRTVMRSASMNILQLRELTERTRRLHLQETFTKKLQCY